jgi:lipid-binding SYLF domain-containing protein
MLTGAGLVEELRLSPASTVTSASRGWAFPAIASTLVQCRMAHCRLSSCVHHKRISMNATRTHILIAAGMVCMLAVMAYAADPKIEKKQKDIRSMADDTLQRLYKADPQAKSAVKDAAGYAVFSNLGIKILVAGSGNGKGIAVNNKSKHETFMKMLELQAGLGVGVKKFSVIFVFTNEKALDGFVNSGWQFGGQTTAAVKNGDKGASLQGAASVSDGIWMYQLTDKGLALEITAKSTKYYKDDDLN